MKQPFLILATLLISMGAGCAKQNTQKQAQTQTLPIAVTKTTTTTVDYKQTSKKQNPVTNCKGTNPKIISIFPTSGPVGTKIKIMGCNLTGFDTELIFVMNNSYGEGGFLENETPGDSILYGTSFESTLRSPLCQQDLSYTGGACTSKMILTPGKYTIYTAPWGKMSNLVNFTIR